MARIAAQQAVIMKRVSLTRRTGTPEFDAAFASPPEAKIQLPNGRIRWEKIVTDYLPVAPRIAWFRKEHPDWSIVTKAVYFANNAVIMKATVQDADGRTIATARKRETVNGFPDYVEKAETGAVGRALAMCGYGTLQAPEFDEGDRLADAPVEDSAKRH